MKQQFSRKSKENEYNHLLTDGYCQMFIIRLTHYKMKEIFYLKKITFWNLSPQPKHQMSETIVLPVKNLINNLIQIKICWLHRINGSNNVAARLTAQSGGRDFTGKCYHHPNSDKSRIHLVLDLWVQKALDQSECMIL